MRLHKLLASLGLGSRRAIEGWIKEGKIIVNGSAASIGQAVTLQDKVYVSGKPVNLNQPVQPLRILIYNKPEGEICSRVDEEERGSVFNALPNLETGRWVMVGRLDVNTSGLLLFTNQGELAHQLMHPRFQIDRQYAVRVVGKITENTLLRLKKGVMLPQGLCRFKEITARISSGGLNQWFTVILSEGKYREVRELFASQGATVSRLIRIKYGDIALPKDLDKGQWQELPLERVEALSRKWRV